MYERHRPAGEVTMMSSSRAKTVTRAIPVPVNLVQGGEVNLRHIAPRPLSHAHTELTSIKTEKT